MNKQKLQPLVFFLATATFLGFAPVYAQDSLDDGGLIEEIVVTAQKREQRIQDVPMAVSVLSEDKIVKLGLDDLKSFTRKIPGVVFVGADFAGERGGPNVVIRGVSNNRLAGADVGLAVATTSLVFGDIPVQLVDPRLYDVKRVEALKGPQGTLYGTAAMGGLLKIVPNLPEPNEFSADVTVEGSHTFDGANSNAIAGKVNIPLIADTLALRASAYSYDDGGWIAERTLTLDPSEVRGGFGAPIDGFRRGIENDGVKEDANNQKTVGGRVAVRWVKDDNWDVTGAFTYQSNELNAFTGFDRGLNEGFVRERWVPERQVTEFWLNSLDASYDLGAVSLISATGFYHRDQRGGIDATAFAFALKGATPDGMIPARVSLTANSVSDIFTQEFRLQSNPSDSQFDYILGAFYQEEDRNMWLTIESPVWNSRAAAGNEILNADGVFFSNSPVTHYENSALFGDVTWHVTDDLDIAGGLRYFDQSFVVTNRNFAELTTGTGDGYIESTGMSEEDGVTPRLNVSYNLGDDKMVYASAAKGFRIGGINDSTAIVNQPECAAVLESLGITNNLDSFVSDTLWSYEVGVKTQWQDGRIVANASVYNIDWDDYQQSIFLGAVDPTCGASITANLGRAEIKGIDADVSYQVDDSWNLGLSVSYNEARLAEVPTGGAGSVGDRLQNTPDFTASGYVEYSFPVATYDAFAMLEFSHVGDRIGAIGGTNPFQDMPAFTVAGLRLGVTLDNWRVIAYLDNLTDEIITLNAQPIFFETHSGAVISGRPRTIGVKVIHQW